MWLDEPTAWPVLTHAMLKLVTQRRDTLHLINSGFLPAQRDAFCQSPSLSHSIRSRKDHCQYKTLCWQNQKKWSTEGHKSTARQSRIRNTTCLPHRLCNPHEPERDGFQHVKILREYWKKWHAMGGYMIFWFTKAFCKLPQTFHGRLMKIIMAIHTFLGIFKSLNQQRQAHGLFKYCRLACPPVKFHEPWNEQITHGEYKTYNFVRAAGQLRKLRTPRARGVF